MSACVHEESRFRPKSAPICLHVPGAMRLRAQVKKARSPADGCMRKCRFEDPWKQKVFCWIYEGKFYLCPAGADKKPINVGQRDTYDLLDWAVVPDKDGKFTLASDTTSSNDALKLKADSAAAGQKWIDEIREAARDAVQKLDRDREAALKHEREQVEKERKARLEAEAAAKKAAEVGFEGWREV